MHAKSAIEALVAADTELSPEQKRGILAALADERRAFDTERLLSRREVAARLRRSVRTIDLLARKGVLRRVRLPGHSRSLGFRAEDVRRLICGEDKQQQGGLSDRAGGGKNS